ncbi:hypothetical protein N6H18_12765 [Reichenbachiella agarivorans]|uniref:Secreted protein n=1 Tax=Reichenbachiella agarivorans TaxID=2979464 RepID=A0ABY6CL28_9BACT|nr:hypothetical protein [Reichenbachiella agarivorans]UXP31220.1 hypothetical protein N6H18_12765 [Reichenbachiella agarivorans]
MSNASMKYFLSLLVFLIGGYGSLCAHLCDGNFYSPSKNLISLTDTNYGIAKDNHLPHDKSCLSATEKEAERRDEAFEDEVEEEKTDSSKKQLDRAYYFSPTLYYLTRGYSFHYVKNTIPLYIKFLVIRI